MFAAPYPDYDAWKKWAVMGDVIQIQGVKFLFKPQVSTHPFWLYPAADQRRTARIGRIALIIQADIFSCDRIIPIRGQIVKVPLVQYRGDELEAAKGRLLQHCDTHGNFLLDIGFPIIVKQLDVCTELDHTRIGDIISIEFVPPTQAIFA